jgi:hypothetical protein
MASFSVMIGKRITTARNHIKSPTIHSEVDLIEELRPFGGSGRGFAFALSLTIISFWFFIGATGSGFEFSSGADFGGTGGPWAAFGALRLLTSRSRSMEVDMLA